MVNAEVPVLATVKVCEADEPVATEPNDPLAPETATVVVVVGSVALALVKPVHPTWVKLMTRAAASAMKTKGLFRLDSVGRASDFVAAIVLKEANRWFVITR
jgi:hypothetical protein